MKVAVVSTELLTRRDSLRASDFLCPDSALESSIVRLEKARQSIEVSLGRKRAELAERRHQEDLDIAAGRIRPLGGF